MKLPSTMLLESRDKKPNGLGGVEYIHVDDQSLNICKKKCRGPWRAHPNIRFTYSIAMKTPNVRV